MAQNKRVNLRCLTRAFHYAGTTLWEKVWKFQNSKARKRQYVQDEKKKKTDVIHLEQMTHSGCLGQKQMFVEA